jgi:hypothetical protein
LNIFIFSPFFVTFIYCREKTIILNCFWINYYIFLRTVLYLILLLLNEMLWLFKSSIFAYLNCVCIKYSNIVILRGGLRWIQFLNILDYVIIHSLLTIIWCLLLLIRWNIWFLNLMIRCFWIICNSHILTILLSMSLLLARQYRILILILILAIFL